VGKTGSDLHFYTLPYITGPILSASFTRHPHLKTEQKYTYLKVDTEAALGETL